MGDEVKSQDLALRAQKKFLSKIASKKVTKLVVDDKTGIILDEFYRIRKMQTGNKKDAEKLVHNLIKVMIKIAILHKNGQFSSGDMKLLDSLQHKTRMTSMTIVSFCEVEFTFDKDILSKMINDGRDIMLKLVSCHLTDKSKARINSVFDVLGNADFLTELFTDEKYRPSLCKITKALNELLEHGEL